MTSNHTLEPSEEDRELLNAELQGAESGYSSSDDVPVINAALRAIAKARALRPSPDDRMGDVAEAGRRAGLLEAAKMADEHNSYLKLGERVTFNDLATALRARAA